MSRSVVASQHAASLFYSLINPLCNQGNLISVA